MTLFMREFRRYEIPEITADEERELIAAAQQGDIQAHNTVVYRNIPFALNIAKRYYSNSGTSRADIVQSAFWGLVAAVNQYDVRYGTKFVTFAYYWIKRYILQEINDIGPVHLPIGYARRLERGMLSESAAKATEQYLQGILSIDGPCEDGKDTIKNTLCDGGRASNSLGHNLDRQEIIDRVRELINEMPDPMKSVILMRLEKKTISQIADEMDVSCDAIRQYEEAAKTYIYKKWGRRTIY